MISTDYNPPDMLADEVAAFYGDKRDVRVLDLAAGTGRVGKAVSGLVTLQVIFPTLIVDLCESP